MTHDDTRRRSRSTQRESRSEGQDIAQACYRHTRLQHLLYDELRALLRDELTDPLLAGMALLTCELSPDYHHVKARYALPGDLPAARRMEAGRAVERVAGFFRARLAESMDLKRVPQIRFVLDPDVRAEDVAPVDPDAPDAPGVSVFHEAPGEADAPLFDGGPGEEDIA
jgi:ribosome-binding factor A